jgi:hypothetical protein
MKGSTIEPFPDSVGVFSGGAGAAIGPEWVGRQDLHRRYEAYCLDQGRGLLAMVPRDAIRAMMRAAHEWAVVKDIPDTGDPMELLVRYARSILPLPPLEVWLEDVRRAPLHHLESALPGPVDDIRRTPIAVACREAALGEATWSAVLMVFPEPAGGRWHGFVAFGDRPDRLLHRTADIFRDSDPYRIRDEFLSSDLRTISSLLRSASI